MTRQNKMMLMVNGRVRVTLNDGRVMLGQLLAFDKYMNLVLADCDEYRRVKGKGKGNSGDSAANSDKQMRRSLGMIILRGESVLTCSLESGAPPSGFENKARVPAAQQMAPGARPGARPIPGVVPAPGMMMPPMAGMYMRPGMPPVMPGMMMPGGMMMPPPPPPQQQQQQRH